MRVVNTQMSEILTVIRQLPAKLGYARPNAITLHDPCGNNTILPMIICESSQQFSTVLRLISSKWPLCLRNSIDNCTFHALCEESETTVSPLCVDDEQVWSSTVAPGRTIRIFCFMTLFVFPNEDGAPPCNSGARICPECGEGSAVAQ